MKRTQFLVPIAMIFLSGFVATALNWREHRQAQDAARWPTAEATILSCSLRDLGPVEQGVRLEYSYEVGGHRYVGTRYYRNDALDSDPELERFVDAHPPGTRLLVHYDPGDPAFAVVATRARRQSRIQYWMGFVLMAGAVIALAFTQGAGIPLLGLLAAAGFIGLGVHLRSWFAAVPLSAGAAASIFVADFLYAGWIRAWLATRRLGPVTARLLDGSVGAVRCRVRFEPRQALPGVEILAELADARRRVVHRSTLLPLRSVAAGESVIVEGDLPLPSDASPTMRWTVRVCVKPQGWVGWRKNLPVRNREKPAYEPRRRDP